jgi:hypothetical protein
MFNLADPVGNVLRRAAYLAELPDGYSRSAALSAFDPWNNCHSVSGLLERANCRRTQNGNAPLVPKDPIVLAAAKERMCRIVGHPHLDGWEIAERPTPQRIAAVFEAATK